MSISFLRRFYCNTELAEGTEVLLPEPLAFRLSKVLRLTTGEQVLLFNGQGSFDFEAELIVDKKKTHAKITHVHHSNRESPLKIHLGQGIAKGERMDYVFQKATELGFSSITPVICQHTVVKLNAEQMKKKLDHWQAIVIAASEQCGRNIILEIHPPLFINEWLKKDFENKIFLDPINGTYLSTTTVCSMVEVAMSVGPEGGFSAEEEFIAQQCGWRPILLGSRIFRTETASIALGSVLQHLYGDFK